MTPKELTYCKLTNDSCTINGKTWSNADNLPVQEWMKSLFTGLEIDYPKFYKMDGLSKLGLLGVEFLRKSTNLPTDCDNVALVFVNKFSSLDADLSHQELIEKTTASPAIFVYTLPNIVLGELSIRNKWYGEQQFFIKNEWPGELIHKYIVTIFDLAKADTIVIGSADYFKGEANGKWVVLTKEQYAQEHIRNEMNTFFE